MAESKLRSLGIEVHTDTKVTGITEDYVVLSTLETETTVASQTVIGDIALYRDENGEFLPGLAPVAMQQGQYVATSIRAVIQRRHASDRSDEAEPWRNGFKNTIDEPFRYRDRGTMATIGRVAEIGQRRFSGLLAWLLWLFVHLLLIVQFQNRLLILLQWAWHYTTFSRSARLITGGQTVIARMTKTAERESPPTTHSQQDSA